MEELKCCPFCGGEASTETYQVSTGCDSKCYLTMIRCNYCCAQMKTSKAHKYLEEAINEVIEAWNRRAE